MEPPNAARWNGETALMWAAAEGHTDVVELLIREGTDVNATSKTGFSPLAFAVIQNDLESIGNLIQAGANATGAHAGRRDAAHRGRKKRPDAGRRVRLFA